MFVNADKTELWSYLSDTPKGEEAFLTFKVGNEDLKNVNIFKYLDSSIYFSREIENVVSNRIKLASDSFWWGGNQSQCAFRFSLMVERY